MSDLSEIKKLLQELRRNQLDIILRLEVLEDQVAAGEAGRAKPRVPEPILTCVQCKEDYKESQNAEGSCKYHPSFLQGAGWDYIYQCCNNKSRNYDAALLIPGCKKGRHCSEHHENYTYAAYKNFMIDVVKTAKQIWLEFDVYDYIAVGCKWAEVGLSDDDKVYVVCGENRVKYACVKVLSLEQLKEYTNESTVILRKTGEAGWDITASVVVNDGSRAIEVSVKPASSTQATIKRAILDLTGAAPALANVEMASGAKKGSTESYTVPDDTAEGPVIDVGEDLSKDRKNDYQAETDDKCPLKLQQKDNTKADSNLRAQDGKWNNLFTAVVMVTNTDANQLAITGVEGYYTATGGDWVKCDDCWIGVESFRDYHFYDTPNFNIDSNSTGTLAVRLCVKIPGTPPCSGPFARRAHSSLPQPLHLKAVFTDQADRKASIRFEFGNTPIDLPTRETRQTSWAKNGLYQYCFADDLNKTQRSDACLYYNDDGGLCYRPALEGMGSNIYDLDTNVDEFAYQAKQAGKAEFEIEKYVKKNDATEIRTYALVDLINEIVFGFKITIKTPTSFASSHCLLPPVPDPSNMILTLSPESVKVGNEITVRWQVPRAAEGDHIYMYSQNGKKNLDKSYFYNKEAKLTGETVMKAPTTPGVYEARYFPAALTSQKTGNFHNTYWIKALVSVMA